MDTNKLTEMVMEYLNKTGKFFVWRNNNLAVRGRRFVGLKGVPDIIGFNRDGIFVGIEIKNPETGDKLSPEQKNFGEHCNSFNAFYWVIGSFEDIKKIIG